RLHRGRFVWPRSDREIFTLDTHEWQWLITGIDWQRLSAKPMGFVCG
ncbi:IS66 family insertion sequence element accessory protein TnpB, partial [Iodobacter sp. BJB302]